MSHPRCRLCSIELRHIFVDLGMSPPCESYLDQLGYVRGWGGQFVVSLPRFEVF